MRIAVYGKLRAGKSAVATVIKENLEDCEHFEFGDVVQEVVDLLYPNEKGVKNRELLVGVGQHMRKFDEDVWVNIIKNRIENCEKENVLVAGVRQKNEYDMLKKLGFKFIQVEASETTRVERCLQSGDSFKKEALRDYTEMVLDDFEYDYLILNEKGFKELEISTRNILGDMVLREWQKTALSETFNFSKVKFRPIDPPYGKGIELVED